MERFQVQETGLVVQETGGALFARCCQSAFIELDYSGACSALLATHCSKHC